jgi:hypothetical protein
MGLWIPVCAPPGGGLLGCMSGSWGCMLSVSQLEPFPKLVHVHVRVRVWVPGLALLGPGM